MEKTMEELLEELDSVLDSEDTNSIDDFLEKQNEYLCMKKIAINYFTKIGLSELVVKGNNDIFKNCDSCNGNDVQCERYSNKKVYSNLEKHGIAS